MIGVYGGTFDPIHYGHLRTALEVCQSLNLQEMRMIPCRVPAHRDTPGVSAEQRFAMLQLALQEQSQLVADQRELEREGPSFMVDTLQSLRDEHPDTALVLCLGYDAFAEIERWHRWQDLFALAHVLVLTRPGYQAQPMSVFLQQRFKQSTHVFADQRAGSLSFFKVTALDISATAIRQYLAQGLNPRFLMPDAVIDYIHQHQLYRSI